MSTESIATKLGPMALASIVTGTLMVKMFRLRMWEMPIYSLALFSGIHYNEVFLLYHRAMGSVSDYNKTN